MKKKILISIIAAILLIATITVAVVAILHRLKYMNPPTINGVSLKNYTIVYDEDSLDYNKRAAEYIKNTAHSRYGVNLQIIDDDSQAQNHEIVVGETSRAISKALDADTQGLEFSILAKDGSIALEGDYFVIAAAAFYFMESHALTDSQVSNVPETISVKEPIVKEAKNYIMLIGDGMGLYQTKMFEYMKNDCEYSDGEDIFYGYMLPYSGFSKTNSINGTTDSAAGGTALSCGYKTYNGWIGIDRSARTVKSLTELASELGMSAAVMSTESKSGATPASFLAHVNSRDNTVALTKGIIEAQQKYGTIVNCSFDYYDKDYMEDIKEKVTDTLASVSTNKNGFFLMYEEAHIDKHSHKNYMDKTFKALIRFNQTIARFMEFAFYNPETFVLITADHETGDLRPNDKGNLVYNSGDHSNANVPIFAYGHGAELFNGVTIENIQIAHTIASFMGDDNFGDQSEFQSLTKGK